MIRICFCTIAFQRNKWGRDRTVERPVARVLPLLADAGYDAVELWAPHVTDLGEAGLTAVEAALAETGLEPAMVSPYFDFTTSDETAEASLAHGREVLALARRLGGRNVRCFTGKTGSAEATPAQWDRAVRCLRALADAAAGDGIGLALETHSRNLMDTVASARDLVERVARANVGLILQPGTFAADPLGATRALAPLARHVHATNRKDGERARLEEGAIDWSAVLAILVDAGFGGAVSVEWMGEEPEAVARHEAAALRRLIAEVGGA